MMDPHLLDAIGADDWAFRKGMKYGTAIINLHGNTAWNCGQTEKQLPNANIGGAISTAVIATSLNRSDLRFPGTLVGPIGNAMVPTSVCW